MHLELNESQRVLVLDILRSRLMELRPEIRRSTVSTFTDQLKKTESLLKSAIREIEYAAPTAGHSV